MRKKVAVLLRKLAADEYQPGTPEHYAGYNRIKATWRTTPKSLRGALSKAIRGSLAA